MIQLSIKTESDLYNNLDATKSRVNTDVYNFLKSFCNMIDEEKHTLDVVQIISDSPIDSDRFQKVLQDNVRREQELLACQMKTNSKRALQECIVGSALSVAGLVLAYKTDQVLLSLISFFGTMTLRSGITIWAIVNPDIKRLKNRLNPLLNSTIEVIEK